MTSTVYTSEQAYGGIAVVSNSSIVSWNGWPEDVVDIVRRWNSDGRLRFVYTRLTFKCLDCKRFVNAAGSTAAQFDHALMCDDCVIARARKFDLRGRPETELEKAKRWCRSLQGKIERMRHNATEQSLLVRRLRDVVDEYAWHSRTCSAINADGEWHQGAKPCDCGYDEAIAALFPDRAAT